MFCPKCKEVVIHAEAGEGEEIILGTMVTIKPINQQCQARDKFGNRCERPHPHGKEIRGHYACSRNFVAGR